MAACSHKRAAKSTARATNAPPDGVSPVQGGIRPSNRKRRVTGVELLGRHTQPAGDRRRAAIYLRVSTDEQTVENQRPELDQVVRTRGLELVRVDVETGSAAARARPAFDELLNGARRGEFDVLVIWALDRFGRSMVGNLTAVLELDRLGVEVVSVREPWLDTGGPVRQLLLAIFSWVAEQERVRLGERTRAGLDRARAKGTPLGRPRARVDVRRARVLEREGLSVRAIARELRVPATTLRRALQ